MTEVIEKLKHLQVPLTFMHISYPTFQAKPAILLLHQSEASFATLRVDISGTTCGAELVRVSLGVPRLAVSGPSCEAGRCSVVCC